MFTVDDRVELPQPPEAVFAFLADVRNVPKWRPEVLAVDGVSGPLSHGARFGETVNFMGRKTFRFEVAAFEPPRRIVTAALSGPVRPVQSFTVERAPGGSVLILHVEVTCLGFFRLLEPLFPGMFRKLWRGYLSNLRALLS